MRSNGVVTTIQQCPWTFAQSFYFSVQTGLSIGFGLLSESQNISKLYSCVHILAGSSVISGALALFAQLALARHTSFQSKEEKLLAEASEKLHADGYKGFTLSQLRGLMVTYPHYANAIIRKTYKDHVAARQMITEFKAADHQRRQAMADEILHVSVQVVEQFKCANVLTIRDIEEIDQATAPCTSRIKRAMGKHFNFILACTAFIVWIVIGLLFSVYADGNDFVTGLYYAVSTLSTAGMVAVKTVESQAHVLFTAFYALIGVPIYGLFLGMFANLLIDGYYKQQVQDTLKEKFNRAELEFLDHIADNDQQPDVNFAEFVEFQLLRLGKVDRDLIESIRKQFRNLDTDGSGRVRKAEFLHQVDFKEALASPTSSVLMNAKEGDITPLSRNLDIVEVCV